MKKILIIEDDLDIQELIQFFLEDQGYEVITASDGIDGIAVFLKEQIDLILLDILLPKMDGYAVCELIRKESEVPIIMISALGREEDQIKGFEMQIDDYIPKPISLPIMIKKIEAVLRRYEGVDITKDHELKYREIILIVGNYQVKIGKKLIDLTQKEYEILKELIENQGCVITRESFLNRLWKYEFEGEERAVDNHIKNLRRKLGKAGDYIKTVRGVGYRIDKAIREHLSTKIFIITVCLLITVGGAIYGMVALGMSRSYFLELDRSLSNQTEKMVLQLSNTSVQEIDGILKMFALEHGISIVLKDSDEKVLGIYGDMEYSLAPGTDVEDILLGSGITESYSCKLTNGKTYWIQVFGNKEKVNIGLESLKRILPMLGAITFLAALAIAALYTKYITRSILKVSEVSKKMANLDFRVRYTEDRRDEIGILGENLNELSEKLESALDELKEKNTDLEKSIKLEQQLEQQQMAFFSAVSHELKTPITILKGQIQGMLLEVGGYKDRDRYLKRSFEVANSMENMVQEILYVSKIRTSGFELKLIDIPLHQLVENVIKEQEDMAIDRGLQFHIRIEESTWIRADEALFTKVISNVVGNAIKYTNEDGNIWVGVYKRGEEIIFWIENETESIDEKEIPKLCDAFYRIDKSRNKRTGGSGLGLYITKMILEQHQFPYCIENTEKGIKVEIRCYEPTRRLL